MEEEFKFSVFVLISNYIFRIKQQQTKTTILRVVAVLNNFLKEIKFFFLIYNLEERKNFFCQRK